MPPPPNPLCKRRQVGDLPEDQITLRALRDVNVPKFLKAGLTRTSARSKDLGPRSCHRSAFLGLEGFDLVLVLSSYTHARQTDIGGGVLANWRQAFFSSLPNGALVVWSCCQGRFRKVRNTTWAYFCFDGRSHQENFGHIMCWYFNHGQTRALAGTLGPASG